MVRRIFAKYHHLSIWLKLSLSFLVGCMLFFFINGLLYVHIRGTMGQLDTVYSSNVRLNRLANCLEELHSTFYQYLETRSSVTLENYYVCEQEYRELCEELNEDQAYRQSMLLGKNIYYISQSYLDSNGATIHSRRGRDVTRYKESYARSKRLYGYIHHEITILNDSIFQKNSEDYLVLRKSFGHLMILATSLLVLVMVITIAWVFGVTRSLIRPLIDLAKAANEIARGNMEVDFPMVDTGDEISVVEEACNKMMAHIRRYILEIRENYEREAELTANELMMKNDLKEAQLKYLQAQINPHFLFNTLNAGVQLAMMEGAEKTCVFLEKMADFFRYNVRKIDQDTTLGEEIELVESYIYILNVRFAGEIHYHTQIDPRLTGIRMPGMVLQPLIENAVNHGIRNKEDEGHIFLQVTGEGDRVLVEIRDNGPGMDQEMVDRIMRAAANQVRSYEDSGSSGSGIGLYNVISRLNRYFGRRDIFEIDNNREGSGVTVRIRI